MAPSPKRRILTIPGVLMLTAGLLMSLLGPWSIPGAAAPMWEMGGAPNPGPVGLDPATASLTSGVFVELLAGDSTVSADLIAADAILLTPEGLFIGPEGFDAFLAALRAPFQDLRFTIADIAVYGDTVAVRWTMAGRVGAASPLVELRGSSVLQIVNGEIVRHGFQYDHVELASQIEIARYTEMEIGRGGAAVAGQVAGVQEAPTPRPQVCPPCMTPE